MNIGYVYELTAYPPRGGNHRHAYELVQEFHKLDHKVLVLGDPSMPNASNYPAGSLDAFLADAEVLYIRIDGRLTTKSQTITELVTRAKIPIVWEVNAPANESLAFSWLGGKMSDGPESTLRRARRWLHAKRQSLRIFKEESHRAKLAAKVSAAICVSEALKRYATEQLGIQNTLVIPNGGPLISRQEIEERRARRKSKQFTVLYSGSAIYPWQGMQYISDAVKLAEKTVPEVKFVLAVNQRTSFLPTSANVEIREGLDREGILDAICQSDVCVALHPEYFWSQWKFHGSPMKLFEYMGCMSASLSSDLGQMRDLISHGVDGFLCKNNAEDILTKVQQLQSDAQLRERIALNGWNRVQSELNWTRNAEKTVALFDDLIKRVKH